MVAIGVVLLLIACQRPAVAADDDAATLLRVFLRDGSSLVSYGEPALVGDRVVFSMPTEATPNPALHLVNLKLDRVDWTRTEQYASAARAAQYVKSQAELDYAQLSTQLAQTLNDVGATSNPADRLEIVERARKALVEWPQNHYNYRQADVRQMVGMLDEAIADLRAATGASRFSITLSAFAETTAVPVALLPPLTLQESIEQVLNAARSVDSSVERTSLLSTALASLERDKASLPAEWAAATSASVRASIDREVRVDGEYRTLTTSVLSAADRRARAADVRGIERLLARLPLRDRALGAQRPETIGALVGAVQEKLDAARRLRLARDRWELRLPALIEYSTAIRGPFALFARVKPQLEDIKALAGSSPSTLSTLERSTAQLLEALNGIAAPEEIVAAHALLTSAAQLAASAVAVRREATLANDIDRAWNASSAAAGALMLGTRARADILSLLQPPQLR
jgi:hypothetical protein